MRPSRKRGLLHFFAGVLSATAVSAQSQIYNLPGDEDGSRFGRSICIVDDVNGDGHDDMLIGAYRSDLMGAEAGSAVLCSGADGLPIHEFLGADAGDRFGWAVGSVSDLNGDGVDDLLVGAPQTRKGGAIYGPGYAHVYSGASGVLLFEYTGQAADGNFGHSLAGVGDADGDGRGDFLVGAPHEDPGGAAYFFTGSGSVTHFALRSPVPDAGLGISVGAAGDVDADGHPDVIIGANHTTMGAGETGAALVISTRTAKVLHAFSGEVDGDHFGWSVASAGDLDQDGHDDLIIGAPGGSSSNGVQTGYAKVYSGKGGTVIRKLEGLNTQDVFGWSVNAAGDVNFDGVPDVVVGSPHSDEASTNGGAARVYSGRDGTEILTYLGQYERGQLGVSVHGGGDINGDGNGDLVASAPSATILGSQTGKVEVHSPISMPLTEEVHLHSLQAGQSHQLNIDMGPDWAYRAYWVLGSASGSFPGTDAFGAHVPLNWDFYFCEALVYPNQPPLLWNLSALNAEGKATSTFVLAAEWDPSLAGMTLHHAFIIFDDSIPSIDFVSNLTPLTLVE